MAKIIDIINELEEFERTHDNIYVKVKVNGTEYDLELMEAYVKDEGYLVLHEEPTLIIDLD